MPERSILLVEDNPDDVALAQRALKRSGIAATMHVACSGKEAWTRLTDTAPQAIFLDLNMPEWSGFDLLKKLRSEPRTRHLPIVILTTSKEPADIARCYDLGANSYITKPLDFSEFSEAFAQMMKYWLDFNQAAVL